MANTVLQERGLGMTDRSYAEWVRPIAATLWNDRWEVIAYARSSPAEAWSEPTEIEGWSRKDILAHLAGGNDQMVQLILRAVTSGETLADEQLQPDTDTENAERVEERRRWTVEELIAELERDGDEVMDLLSKLSEEDEHLPLRGLSMNLGQFLRVVHHERHDAEHLRQMRGRRR